MRSVAVFKLDDGQHAMVSRPIAVRSPLPQTIAYKTNERRALE